jgi:hypothetical protein
LAVVCVGAALISLTAGCARSANASEGTPEARAAIAAGPVVAKPMPVLALARPSINLVEAGQEPRQSVYLLPQPGVVQTVTVSQGGRHSFTVDGEAYQAAELPTLTVAVELRVPPGTEQPEGAVVGVVDTAVDGGSDSEVARYARSTLNGMTGEVNVGLEPGGGLVGPQPVLADNAEGQLLVLGFLERNVVTLVDPLPAEPIGVGAEWTTATQHSIEGFPITVFTRYTVTSIGDGVVAADLTRTVSFTPGLHPGAQILENSRLTGSGTATWQAGAVVGTASYELVGAIRYRLNRAVELTHDIRRTVRTTVEVTVPPNQTAATTSDTSSTAASSSEASTNDTSSTAAGQEGESSGG